MVNIASMQHDWNSNFSNILFICYWLFYQLINMYLSRPMNGKTVEIRLIIFRARTLQILAQISYYTLADFSSARSRVDGLHITPPPASNGGEAKETHGPRSKGGRPRRGAGAGEVGVFPR